MALGIERDPEVRPFLEALTNLCREHRVVLQPGRDDGGFWLVPMLASEAEGSYAPAESPAEFRWRAR